MLINFRNIFKKLSLILLPLILVSASGLAFSMWTDGGFSVFSEGDEIKEVWKPDMKYLECDETTEGTIGGLFEGGYPKKIRCPENDNAEEEYSSQNEYIDVRTVECGEVDIRVPPSFDESIHWGNIDVFLCDRNDDCHEIEVDTELEVGEWWTLVKNLKEGEYIEIKEAGYDTLFGGGEYPIQWRETLVPYRLRDTGSVGNFVTSFSQGCCPTEGKVKEVDWKEIQTDSKCLNPGATIDYVDGWIPTGISGHVSNHPQYGYGVCMDYGESGGARFYGIETMEMADGEEKIVKMNPDSYEYVECCPKMDGCTDFQKIDTWSEIGDSCDESTFVETGYRPFEDGQACKIDCVDGTTQKVDCHPNECLNLGRNEWCDVNTYTSYKSGESPDLENTTQKGGDGSGSSGTSGTSGGVLDQLADFFSDLIPGVNFTGLEAALLLVMIGGGLVFFMFFMMMMMVVAASN